MTYIQWEDKFSVGIREMDDQHMRIVELINELHECRMEGKPEEAIAEILDSVADYIRVHFTAEEQLMISVRYPGFDEHHAEHVKLIQKTAELRKRMTGGTPPTTFEVLNFLKRWLIEHIMESDKVIGKYIANKIEQQPVE